MTIRPDIADRLVHFTGGGTPDEAFGRLCSIISERRLVGTGEMIRGSYRCVCFTEAPLPSLQHGLVNPSAYSRYQPFGIVVDKSWLFRKGGRPVIYQSNSEYELLPSELKWRHVRYEPDGDPIIDFSWEREWRIYCDELQIEPASGGIVVPSQTWAEKLTDAHDEEQDFLVREYSLIMSQSIAEQYRETFSWPVYVLT